MSVCKKRLILWLLLAVITLIGGVITDLMLQTTPFPTGLRIVGLTGMLLTRIPLKRTGRILSRMGKPEEWGCTSRLVTSDIYSCLRHPHHLFIGVFMTSLGLFIGHIWSFILISVTQWIWILGFLFLVEEKELFEKFKDEYERYCQKVPMLVGNPICIFKVLASPFEGS